MRAKSRQIESKDKRVVHFLYTPGSKVKAQVSPFMRKYNQNKDGTMVDEEAKERADFDEYINKILGEEFDPNTDKYPIEYGEM